MNSKYLKSPLFWSILAVDLLPAAGYFLWQWRVVDLVFLFWAETVVLFLVAVATSLTGPHSSGWSNVFGGAFLGGWLILLLLMLICGLDPRLSEVEKNWPYMAFSRLMWKDKVWIQILPFSILHWAWFFSDLVERGRMPDPVLAGKNAAKALRELLVEPVGRIMILFLSIFLGVSVSHLLHNFDGVFFFLLVFKTSFDLYAYLKFSRSGNPS